MTPFDAAIARATRSVPASKGGVSNIPGGPFQRIVAAFAISASNSAAVAGPMSSPIMPSGTLPATTRAEAPSPGPAAQTWSEGRTSRTPW